MPSLWARTRTTLEMIKWEHSIFALPFALTAVLLAADGLPGRAFCRRSWRGFWWRWWRRARRRWRLTAGPMRSWTRPILEPKRAQFPPAC